MPSYTEHGVTFNVFPGEASFPFTLATGQEGTHGYLEPGEHNLGVAEERSEEIFVTRGRGYINDEQVKPGSLVLISVGGTLRFKVEDGVRLTYTCIYGPRVKFSLHVVLSIPEDLKTDVHLPFGGTAEQAIREACRLTNQDPEEFLGRAIFVNAKPASKTRVLVHGDGLLVM